MLCKSSAGAQSSKVQPLKGGKYEAAACEARAGLYQVNFFFFLKKKLIY